MGAWGLPWRAAPATIHDNVSLEEELGTMNTTMNRMSALAAPASWPLKALLVIGGSLLLWLSAKVQVPFWPVPMTLQVMALFAIAATFGLRLGVAMVALYVAEGALGLPVFAGTPEKGIGLAYMMGPTGGYILGFLLMAAVVGWLADRGFSRHPLKLFIAGLVGLTALYAPGLAWLAQFVGAEKALAFGLVPFVLGDLLKLVIVALAVPAAWKLTRRA